MSSAHSVVGTTKINRFNPELAQGTKRTGKDYYSEQVLQDALRFIEPGLTGSNGPRVSQSGTPAVTRKTNLQRARTYDSGFSVAAARSRFAALASLAAARWRSSRAAALTA
jgi:hypothetical protein